MWTPIGTRRLTAAQLGRELGVSTEQLRASVQQVYGKPLYQCIRAYKMRVAARLLGETDRTVLDIAGEFATGTAQICRRLPGGAGRQPWGVPPEKFPITLERRFRRLERKHAGGSSIIKYANREGATLQVPWAAERALAPGGFPFASWLVITNCR